MSEQHNRTIDGGRGGSNIIQVLRPAIDMTPLSLGLSMPSKLDGSHRPAGTVEGFDDVGGMALGRSTNGYASLGAVRSAFAAGRYGAQNTEFLQRFDAWLQREALPERVAEFSAQAHAAAEAWRQGRDYLLARDLCSDAAAADLRRVAALGDGAAGAEFLLAFAHYNALDAS